jgi:hypothetical protein
MLSAVFVLVGREVPTDAVHASWLGNSDEAYLIASPSSARLHRNFM